MEIVQPEQKLNQNNITIENQRSKHTEATSSEAKLREILQSVTDINLTRDCPFQRLVGLITGNILSQLDADTEFEKIGFMFSDTELKISDLLNFIQEKEQSGEGITSEEDVGHLMSDLNEIE